MWHFSILGLLDKFGEKRIWDTPITEMGNSREKKGNFVNKILIVIKTLTYSPYKEVFSMKVADQYETDILTEEFKPKKYKVYKYR